MTEQGLILVTGATGFVGKWVVIQLLQAGHRVRGTIRSLSRADEVRASRVSARQAVPVVSAKLVALRRSRVKATRLLLSASMSWRKELTRSSAIMMTAEASAKISNPEI